MMSCAWTGMLRRIAPDDEHDRHLVADLVEAPDHGGLGHARMRETAFSMSTLEIHSPLRLIRSFLRSVIWT